MLSYKRHQILNRFVLSLILNFQIFQNIFRKVLSLTDQFYKFDTIFE